MTTETPVGFNMLPPVHPGEILAEELEERGLTMSELSRRMDVTAARISEIVRGKRSITPDAALRLAEVFGNSARFWLNLQEDYDLAKVTQEKGAAIRAACRPLEVA